MFVKFPGPKKSWNLLGSDADADARICVCNFKKCLSSFLVSNCCLCLYLNIAGIRQGPGKNASGVPEKSWNFFVTKRVGTLLLNGDVVVV